MLPWSAVALPEIMAEVVQESKLNVPVQFHKGRAAGQQPGGVAGARGGGKWKPNRGLTFELSGAPRQDAHGPEWNEGHAWHAVVRPLERRVRHHRALSALGTYAWRTAPEIAR